MCCYGADRDADIWDPGNISDPVTVSFMFVFFNPLTINLSKERKYRQSSLLSLLLSCSRKNKGKIKGTVSYEFKFMVTDRLEITILT